MLLGTLGTSSLGNILASKRVAWAGYGDKKGQGIVRTGHGNTVDF